MKTPEELAVFEAQIKRHTADFPRPVKQPAPPGRKALDRVTFAVIKARLDGILSEMIQTLLRTSRNPILYGAKDCTVCMLTYDGLLLTMANSADAHFQAMNNGLWGVLKAFEGDIHPGDVFMSNDPYYGASHVGDFSMFAPVFFEGELVAWTANVCHLIDCGAHKPTTLDPMAADVYEEGLHFPPFRVCQNHQVIPEKIRFLRANIRYPDQYNGDFLAQVGSVWTGERRMVELCKKYGTQVFKQFQDEYLDYGDRRMTEEIRKLPKGEWQIETLSEKIPPMCPDGAKLKLTMWIDPEEAVIGFDFTDMPDQLPWGYNCSYTTTLACCPGGSLPALDPTLPRCDGVMRHFKTRMREGSMVGAPKWPAGTSIGTTGIRYDVLGMIYRLWEQVKPGMGHGNTGSGGGVFTWFTGTDVRNDTRFGHANILVMQGGGAVKGCDGWPTSSPSGGGNLHLESIEVTEQKVPELVWEVGVEPDSGGAGKWRGAVGLQMRMQPRGGSFKGVTGGTGFTSPPYGVAGGKPGSLSRHWGEKHASRQKVQELSGTSIFEVKQDENWRLICDGGGGYGNPLERDPELVRDDARNGFISLEGARDDYGVVLDTKPELFKVDIEATKKLRAKLSAGEAK